MRQEEHTITWWFSSTETEELMEDNETQQIRVKIELNNDDYEGLGPVRTETVIDKQTGKVEERRRMAAAHILFSFPPTETFESLEKKMAHWAIVVERVPYSAPLCYMYVHKQTSVSSFREILQWMETRYPNAHASPNYISRYTL